MTNKLICHHTEGTNEYVLLHVSIQGQTEHLANHPGDYVPNSPSCQTETPTTPPTTVVEVTTVPSTTETTTTGTPTNVVTDTTVQSQIDTQVLSATVAVPGPIPFQGELAATGGTPVAGFVVAVALIGAGTLALVPKAFRRN